MPSTFRRLTEVFLHAPLISFDEGDKFICFSDCHRGDNGWADDFAHNQTLFFYALHDYYYERDFTYIELGDGDELWENQSFEVVRRAHSHIYWLLQKFYEEGRLYLIFGNHNIRWKYPSQVARHLHVIFDERERRYRPFLPGIRVHEGLRLRHAREGYELFLVHGHQGDLMSDTLWPLGRFFVRYVWRTLQLVGMHDPTSPAQNYQKRQEVEREIGRWVRHYRQPVLCGHTHRPALARPGRLPYFNTGSCVHPRCITGVEIANGEITLIKWWVRPDARGRLSVARDVLAGPYPLAAYTARRPSPRPR